MNNAEAATTAPNATATTTAPTTKTSGGKPSSTPVPGKFIHSLFYNSLGIRGSFARMCSKLFKT